MKIEAGKYYVTRGGDVVGPMVETDYIDWVWRCWCKYGVEFYLGDGRYFRGESDHRDLIKEHVMPSLDLTKPVQTRDGRKVRVLCTDGPKGRPVVGLVGDEEYPLSWLYDGAYYVGALESIYDLINTPATPRTFERWFNVYRNGVGDEYNTRLEADGHVLTGRIARKRVVFTEGEWDE